MGADTLGEPGSSAADRRDGSLYQRVSQTATIREGTEHWTGFGREHEQLQEFRAAVHRVEERSDEGETLEATDGENWTIL